MKITTYYMEDTGTELFKMLNYKPAEWYYKIEYDDTIVKLWHLFGYPMGWIEYYVNNEMEYKITERKRKWY